MKKKTAFLALSLALVGAFVAGRRSIVSEQTRGPEPEPSPGSVHAPAAISDPAAPEQTPTAVAVSVDAAASMPVRMVVPSEPNGVADWRSWRPQAITMEAVPGLPIDFEVQSIVEKADHTEIIASSPLLPGSALVASATDEGIDFLQVIPSEPEYAVHVRGGSATVVEGAAEVACGTLDSEEIVKEVALASHEMAADEHGQYVSDVLYLYDAPTLEAANKQAPDQDGKSLLLNTARNHTTYANKVLNDSSVTTFTWNVAGVEQAPAFTRDGNLETDLNNLTRTTTELGSFADQRAIALGADQTALWVSGQSNYSGIAWLRGYQLVLTWGSGGSTTTHELGHNLGCRHDRREQNAPDGNGEFSYAHRFAYQNKDVGDLMSYASWRYPYFSNADLQVDVSKFLTSGHTSELATIGVPADQPKAAHAVRTIQTAAPSMSTHRTAPGVPVITQQPNGVTVAERSSFSLRVSATGGGLTYQWTKDGADLAGATGATFTKTAALADAGSYTVKVTNSAGTVTSNSASVSVTAAQSPGTSGGGNGGDGGGGGGAFSPWFLLAIAILGLRRLRSRAR